MKYKKVGTEIEYRAKTKFYFCKIISCYNKDYALFTKFIVHFSQVLLCTFHKIQLPKSFTIIISINSFK